MKTIFFSIVVLFTLQATGQSLPDLPMKEDMIFYSFTRNTKEAKNCLWTYYISKSNTFYDNLQKFKDSLFFARFQKTKNQKYGFKFEQSGGNSRHSLAGQPESAEKDCLKQAGSIFKVTYPDQRPGIAIAFMDSRIANNIKQMANVKQEISNGFEFELDIFFKNKKDFTITFRGFKYISFYEQKGVRLHEEIPLEDIYNQLKNSPKITKEQAAFFNDVDFFVKSIERLVLKGLNYAVKTDDL